MSNIISLIIMIGALGAGLILLEADPNGYFDTPSLVIVGVGTIGAAIGMRTFGGFFGMLFSIFKVILPMGYKEGDVVSMAQRMADKVRGAGVPSLTSEIPTAFDEFSRRGIKMVIAGTDSQTIRTVMESELSNTKKRHDEKIGLLNEMSGMAPTFGMMGTILGLIQVLGNLEDTSSLGPSIAVAMITTLYGVIFANVLCVPVAQKLGTVSKRELMLKKMVMEGLLAVQAGENSFLVGERLKAFVSDGLRNKIEGGKGKSKKKTEKHIELATYMNAIDQEKAMAFLAEVKQSREKKDLGQDDAKQMLAELINAAEDKVIMKDFANEFMKSKTAKKLPKGMKRKSKKGKKGKKRRKATVPDEDEE